LTAAIKPLIARIRAEHVNFLAVLQLIDSARAACRACVADDLGFDDSFDPGIMLTTSDVYKLVDHFHMQPRTRDEQTMMVATIKSFDAVGEGRFSLHGVQQIFQRLKEHMQIAERERQRIVAKELGFDDPQLQVLRGMFLDLNPGSNARIRSFGLLQLSMSLEAGVAFAPNLPPVDQRRIQGLEDTVADDPEHQLTFVQYLKTMHQLFSLDEKMAATKEDGQRRKSEFQKSDYKTVQFSARLSKAIADDKAIDVERGSKIFCDKRALVRVGG